MHPFINIATKAVREASKIMLRYYDQLDTLEVSEKSRNDFVTQVDKVAEEIIVEVIRASYPNHSIIGEEGTQISNGEFVWVVDPLDGTNNFIHGFPHFCISLAVKKGAEIIIGVIYDPIRQELFTAAKGEGAQLNNRRIRVSGTAKMQQALIGTGFPFRDQVHYKDYLKGFEAILPESSDVRRAGSAALDLAYVAAGRLDGFWEYGLQQWDIAAGALMIKEAGGMASDFKGTHQFLESGNIVAGNPSIHKALLGYLHLS